MMRWAVVAFALTLAASGARASALDSSASTLFADGDFAAAAAADEAYLRLHPADADARLRLATVRLYENDLAKAEPLLLGLLSAQPASERATRLLNELNRRQEEARRPAEVTGGIAHVPFVAASPLPVVRVVANGQPANFLVDTGADVALEPSFAARIGVQTQASGMGTFAGGKHAPTARGMLRSLALGGATAQYVPVHVLPTHAADLFPNLKIDGIVGTTYFERFLVTIDYPHGELVLRPRSARVSAAFEAAASASQSAIVPCYLVGDHFVFARAQVNSAPEGLFLFDSGLAGGGLLPSAQLVRAAGIVLDTAHATTGTGGGGSVAAIPFRADRVTVGSAVQRDVPGIFTPEGSPLALFPFTAWGAISNDFLRNYAYTVDFDAMHVVLTPTPATQPANAQQILDDGFRKLQSYPVPAYAIWTATWQIRAQPMGYYTGESSSVEVHRYAVRLSDGMENISDPIPSGKLPPATIEPEFLGPFAWMLRSSVRVAPPGGSVTMRPDFSGLKTIASVVAVAKPAYAFSRGPQATPPTESVGGREAYHLTLRPLDEPNVHNLRDLWIDVQTHDVLKAHFVGTYRPVPGAPISPTEATVYFREVLGYWVVTRALWNYDDPPVRYDFDVQNDEIGIPATLPDWLFDVATYRKHEEAGEPDLLGLLLDALRKRG